MKATAIGKRVMAIDWSKVSRHLLDNGYAKLPHLLDETSCAALAESYDDPSSDFRSTIDMARYNFGAGEYKYFAYPLPRRVQTLREALYPPLADIANHWNDLLGKEDPWPRALDAMLAICASAAQTRPTPLLLNYGVGDFNCLHQDIYGDVHFPLQVVTLLSAPGRDFSGGELILVEQRPRMQSRPIVVSLEQGDAVIIPVRERPKFGKSRVYRVQMRHGVAVVTKGQRRTLGLIFHDAK